MSLHQCSSDRELAQRRNTHNFSRLRSHCQKPSNSQNIHKATSSHICTRVSCLSQAGSTAPWLGSAGRSREQAARREKPDAFLYAFACGFFLPTAKLGSVGFAESKALCDIYLWKAIETQEYFPKIKRALRQHSRQGHSRGPHAQMHFRGLD